MRITVTKEPMKMMVVQLLYHSSCPLSVSALLLPNRSDPPCRQSFLCSSDNVCQQLQLCVQVVRSSGMEWVKIKAEEPQGWCCGPNILNYVLFYVFFFFNNSELAKQSKTKQENKQTNKKPKPGYLYWLIQFCLKVCESETALLCTNIEHNKMIWRLMYFWKKPIL